MSAFSNPRYEKIIDQYGVDATSRAILAGFCAVADAIDDVAYHLYELDVTLVRAVDGPDPDDESFAEKLARLSAPTAEGPPEQRQ